MIPVKKVFIFIITVTALAACVSANQMSAQSGQPLEAITFQATATAYAPAPAVARLSEQEGDQQALGEENNPSQQRVILKDAVLNLTVQDVPVKISEIGAMAEEMGGWIVSSSTSQATASNGEKLTRGNITVRVPAERLAEAMERIKTGVEAVNSESITGRDVTQSYVDLSSRLKNLEAAEQQLQSIMDSAKKVEDVLSVYNELVRTRGEIESIRGQLNYFDEASAFSSIQIALNPPTVSPVTTQATGWSPLRTVESALSTLLGLVQDVIDFAIILVIVVLPPVLLLGVPLWLIYRRARRNRRTSAAVVSQP